MPAASFPPANAFGAETKMPGGPTSFRADMVGQKGPGDTFLWPQQKSVVASSAGLHGPADFRYLPQIASNFK